MEVDGQQVTVPASAGSLLDALRDHLGLTSAKDGCSPQGQCGCCTVLVDGAPRVACVTPVKRVEGRRITTCEGLPEGERLAWADAFCATRLGGDHGRSYGTLPPGVDAEAIVERHRPQL